MPEAYERLKAARLANDRDTFAERPARARLRIVRVSDDRREAWGSEDGVGEFPILSFGASALEEGETIIAERDGGNVANPAYRYISHLDSDAPAPGLLRKEPGPPPVFASGTWHTERIDTIDGATFARITIHFQIDPSLGPSKVYISHKPSSVVDWTDQVVPFVQSAAVQSAEISIPYRSGVNIDVQMRAEYQFAYAPSVPSETRVILTPGDTASPGTVTNLLVDVSAAGYIRVEAVGTFDMSRYAGVIYQFATAPGGPAIYQTPPIFGPYLHSYPAGGTLYVAAVAVSRSNVLGTRYPGTTSFDGPHVVAAGPTSPDLTAPDTWGQAIVSGNSVQQPPNGDWFARLTVGFPAGYVFPADYASTVIRIWDGTNFSEEVIPYRGSYPEQRTYNLPYGSYSVWIYGIDRSENKGALSPVASVTINNPGAPGNASTPTTDQIGLAVGVNFAMPSGSQTVELQRATTSGGAGAATIWEGVGTRYLDLHTELTVFPTDYWYRIRGRNFVGDGGWSSWVQGTINALDGVTIAANTINGDRMIANTIDANRIKTNTILTALLKTANSPATRWELEGATGGAGQMQFRGYENVAGVEKKRVQIAGNGFYVYGDTGAVQGQFSRDSSGNARMDFGPNITEAWNPVSVYYDATAAQWVTRLLTYLSRLRFQTNANAVDVMAGDIGADQNIPIFVSGTVDESVVGFRNYGDSTASGLGMMNDGLRVWDGSLKEWRVQNGRWQTGHTILAPSHTALNGPAYYANYGFAMRHTDALGTNGGDWNGFAAFQAHSGNNISMRVISYRGQAGGGWADARFGLWTDVDNSGFVGGSLQLGARGNSPFWALGQGGTADFFRDDANNRITSTRNMHIGGALSKTSGSFIIPDPTPGKQDYEIRHCFVEGPTSGTNLYIYTVSFGPRGGSLLVTDSEGKPVDGATITDRGAGEMPRWEVAIPLPDYWSHLNTPQVAMAHNTGDGWGRCKASLSDDMSTLVLLAEEGGKYTIDLRGNRKDPDAVAWWGQRGVRKHKDQSWKDRGTIVEKRRRRLEQRQQMAKSRENLNRGTLRHGKGVPVGVPKDRFIAGTTPVVVQ